MPQTALGASPSPRGTSSGVGARQFKLFLTVDSFEIRFSKSLVQDLQRDYCSLEVVSCLSAGAECRGLWVGWSRSRASLV